MWYILDGHTPKKCDSILEWAAQMTDENKIVRKTTLKNDVFISTVFLGLDHSFLRTGKPILFETMIFGGPHDEFQERYSTWEEAEEGHERAVKMAEQENA